MEEEEKIVTTSNTMVSPPLPESSPPLLPFFSNSPPPEYPSLPSAKMLPDPLLFDEELGVAEGESVFVIAEEEQKAFQPLENKS